MHKYRIAGFSTWASEVKDTSKLDDAADFLGKYNTTWVDCISPGEQELKDIAAAFRLHRLSIEAYQHVPQRSKVESYGNYFLLLIKFIDYKKDIKSERVAIYVGSNYLITLRERQSQIFDDLFKSIAEKSPMLVDKSTDYLCYLIVDEIVDSYMPILDVIENEIESIEAELLSNPSEATLKKIFKLKKDLLMVRKIVWPVREMLLRFEREDLPNMREKTKIYLRDVYDHIITITDLIETHREVTSAIVESYLSTISNKINQVVKVLTVLASLAVPATVIASIYGMNFDIPEKQIFGPYGYEYALGLIGLSTLLMLYLFKRKKWF